jgi:hypothetical protein
MKVETRSFGILYPILIFLHANRPEKAEYGRSIRFSHYPLFSKASKNRRLSPKIHHRIELVIIRAELKQFKVTDNVLVESRKLVPIHFPEVPQSRAGQVLSIL